MGGRLLGAWAALLFLHACGGNEFASGNSGGSAGSGADAGSGGTAAAGGSGGTSASGGTGAAGTSGSGGTAGSGGSSTGGTAGGDAGADASQDAGPGAITVVQASPLDLSLSPKQTSTITFASLPQAGNAIIVGISCVSDIGDDPDASVGGDCLLPNSSVTDNQSNTYTQVVQGSPITSSHQTGRGYLFIAQPIGTPSGSFTITVDPEGTAANQGIAAGAIEVSGLSAAPSVDATGYTASAIAMTTTAETFLATTQTNELAVAVLTIRDNSVFTNIQHDGAWTEHHVHQDPLNGPPAHSMVSKVLTTAGKASHTWNHISPSRGATGIIATFKGPPQD